MKKGNLAFISACVGLLSLTIFPVALAERGVTDTEIHIGQWEPQTGPAAL